jgi:dTDP-4-dehydrorhamnose 3,5-epimerase
VILPDLHLPIGGIASGFLPLPGIALHIAPAQLTMRLTPTAIPDVVILEPSVFEDDRGWFMETYHEPRFHEALRALGLPVPSTFVQDNHSCSRRGVLRGLHFQNPPHAQGKLVRVVCGSAWDVAVDIRPGSPSRGRWVGVELSADNKRQLWIPEGFAHGFLALEDDTQFLYKTTDVYARECEGAILWSDPVLAISWPVDRLGGPPTVAPKDAGAPRFVP